MIEIIKDMESDINSGQNMHEIASKYKNTKIVNIKNVTKELLKNDAKQELAEIADSAFEMLEGEMSYPIEVKGKNIDHTY